MTKPRIVAFQSPPHPLNQPLKALPPTPEDPVGGATAAAVYQRLTQQLLGNPDVQQASAVTSRTTTGVQQAPSVVPLSNSGVQQAHAATVAAVSIQQAPTAVPSLSNAGVQQAPACFSSAFPT
ncbi:UNVERIFIED_CONTAM: hypothetical protein FKN15_027601 [Acipenser sinensis]